MDSTRISAPEAHAAVQSGQALLVCAYANDEKFRRGQLAGAISRADFEARLPGLAKTQKLIFYCG